MANGDSLEPAGKQPGVGRYEPRPATLSQMTARLAEQKIRFDRDRVAGSPDLLALYDHAIAELAAAGA